MSEKNKKPLEPAELNDEQLEDVAGGADGDTKAKWCDKCGHVLHEYRVGAEGEGWYCTVCGSRYRKPDLMLIGNNTRPGTVSM